ncbi:MAG TPA: TIGR01777 family oxidoreductase [Sporichthyaceae bacterium]|nr:TIGR01777 family oxidoreductase [Sporichthyaceae bacterium]
MKVVVAGSSGLVGTALVAALRADGNDVLRLVRREPSGPDELRWDPEQPLDPAGLSGVDAAVNLAGAGVGDHRWTESYKRTLIDSRVRPTHVLATALAALDPRPSALINASAIGYYGEGGDAELDENSPAGDDFLAGLCQRWEAATAPAEAAGIRVVHARTGLVVSRHGGAWARMFPIFRFGLGGRLGSGKQWWSPISMTDEVRAIQFLLTADGVSGAVNLTGPEPMTNAGVTTVMSQVLNRPALFPAPRFGLRLVLGEFGSEPLRSQRVLPRKLTAAGFTFTHPSVESAVRAALAD